MNFPEGNDLKCSGAMTFEGDNDAACMGNNSTYSTHYFYLGKRGGESAEYPANDRDWAGYRRVVVGVGRDGSVSCLYRLDEVVVVVRHSPANFEANDQRSLAGA